MTSTASSITVREIGAVPDLGRAVAVYAGAFGTPVSGDTVTVELLRVLSVTGHYVAGAFAGEELVGLSAGLFSAPPRSFHSHVTAVRQDARGIGAGSALKQHQRAWVLDRDVSTITWTFDPLVRRNAHFNLEVLGAGVGDYLVDFYGTLDDAVNRGDDSDRLLAEWDLEAATTRRRDSARLPAGAPVLEAGPDDAPVRHTSDAAVVSIAVPHDVEALRASDIDGARAWRREVRRALQAELSAGGEVIGFGDVGYVVRRGGVR